MHNNVHNFVNNKLSKLTAGFFLKALKFVYLFIYFPVYDVICIPSFFMIFLHILQGQSWAPKLYLLLKNF